MLLRCPHCSSEFLYTDMPLEEVMDSNLSVIKKTSERSSWNEVANVIRSKEIYRLFDIGDTINCTLKDGASVLIDVVAINHYNNNEVIFCFHDLFDRIGMNSRDTNRGGFPKSDMLSYLDEIYNKLPDELQALITPRHIVQEFRGEKHDCEAKLWLPSIIEIFGESCREYSCEHNDKQFPFFLDRKNRIKFLRERDLDDSANWWWLRSPYVGYSTNFWLVSYLGYCYSSNASNTYGVCPCFSICINPEQEDI